VDLFQPTFLLNDFLLIEPQHLLYLPFLLLAYPSACLPDLLLARQLLGYSNFSELLPKDCLHLGKL